MFFPMYSRVTRLEKADYASQMHMALVDIRNNRGDIPALAERRKTIAMDMLNIPNDIRIDDTFETSCPQELRTPFLDILYKTFKAIKENSEDGLLCSLLANHAHNIPGCINKKQDGAPMTSFSLNYYYTCERPIVLYGLRGGNVEQKDYGQTWYTDLFATEWRVIEPHVTWMVSTKKNEKKSGSSGALSSIKQETDDEEEKKEKSGGSEAAKGLSSIKQETDDENEEDDIDYTRTDWNGNNPLKLQVIMAQYMGMSQG